jgi:hypothetical protein
LSDMNALEAYVMDAYDTVGYDTTLDYDRRFVFDRVSQLRNFSHCSNHAKKNKCKVCAVFS